MILILYLLAGALAAPKPGSKAAGENALADAGLRRNVQLTLDGMFPRPGQPRPARTTETSKPFQCNVWGERCASAQALGSRHRFRRPVSKDLKMK